MKFLCAGDIALGDHPKTIGHGIYSTYPTGVPEEKVKKLFPAGLKPDFIFGNLEYDLSQKTLNGNSLNDLQCRGIYCYSDFLKKAGFNVLNVANNHIFQHGEKGFIGTLKNLEEHNISFCGTENDFYGEKIINKDGLKIGFIGWSLRPRQHFSEKPLYNEFDEFSFEQQIIQLKKMVNILIISVHWGDEFIQVPSSYEEKIAKKIIEAGANAVIGHHPHVLRKIEKYKNGIIAYSLGNFICDMSWEKRTRETGVLYFEIDNGEIVKWTFYPAIIDKNYFPIYLDDNETEKYLIEFNNLVNRLQEKIQRCGYPYLAKKELKKHQIASFKYFLNNMGRYDFKIFFKILFDAFTSRIRQAK